VALGLGAESGYDSRQQCDPENIASGKVVGIRNTNTFAAVSLRRGNDLMDEKRVYGRCVCWIDR
jgi:hypothetical protein